MRTFKDNEIAILEKMSDNSGWSASRLDDVLKIPKGNILSRYLQPMKKQNIIFEKGIRKTDSNQNEIAYYIVEDINSFESIITQLVKNKLPVGRLKKFLKSEYTNNMIKNFGFLEVYNVLPKDIFKPDFIRIASKCLLSLSFTKKEYMEFSNELKASISGLKPQDINQGRNEISLDPELREIHQQIKSNKIDYIEKLGSLEIVEAVRFYRLNIHNSVKEGLNGLTETVITNGLKEFLVIDNYISPFDSYPVNGPLSLLISKSFQRIYNEAYLLQDDNLELLSKRAATIYNHFPDILFELFYFSKPDKKFIKRIPIYPSFRCNIE